MFTWHTATQCTANAGSSLGSYVYEVPVGPAQPNTFPHPLTTSAMTAWEDSFSWHKMYLSLTYLWVETMCGQLLEPGTLLLGEDVEDVEKHKSSQVFTEVVLELSI